MPMGCLYVHVYYLVHVCRYIHSVGFCIAYSKRLGFSYDLRERVSNYKESAFLMVKELYFRFRNLILYGIIGGFCATLDFGVYTALCQFDIMPYLWANIISIHVGIFTSFLLNRSFNFKVKDKTTKRFLSFYTVGLTGLGISELMLYLMVTLGGMNELVCKLISIVVVALIQFVLNKFITFSK